jgi:hypothetical protein
MSPKLTAAIEPEIARRIEADYREMPGLSLTLPQAARLWQIDVGRCARALDQLVHLGILREVGGQYIWAQGTV